MTIHNNSISERPGGGIRLHRQVDMSMATLFLAIATIVLLTGRLSAEDAQSPRRIFVPVEDLDALVNRDNGGVVLKQAEFEQLLADAKAAGEEHVPGEAVLGNAVYTGRVEGEQLVLAIAVDGTHFHPGWATLPLRVGGLGIESASIGEEAAVITRGDPPEVLRWLLRDQGKSTLNLIASQPLEVIGSDRVAIFELAGAPSGELRLTLPAGKHLQVGGVALQRPAAQDAEAEYVLPIGGHKSIELRITDRASESLADALTFASTAHGLYVAPGEVTWSAKTNLQIIGRKIDRLVASVPRGVEITAIESVGLESWELSDLAESPTRTTITLTWRQSFDGSRAITFRGVLSGLDGEDWTAPNLDLVEVTSHTGVVEVQYPAGIRVQPRTVQGARASVGSAVANGGLAAGAVGKLRYDVWEENFDLAFETAVKSRELHAAMTNLVDVTNDGLMLFTLIDVTPQFDRLFELQLALPAEWEVQELSAGGSAVQWTTSPGAAGINEYRVPLAPPLAPGESRAVRIVARRLLESWPVEQTPVRFALPEVKLPQAGVVEAVYGVTGEDDLILTPVDVSGLDPARRQDLASLERQLSEQGRTLRLGFAYQDTVFSAQIETVRKPTRISAATLTFVELDRETVTSHLETQVRVEGGGAKELKVSLPEAVGEDLRFQLTTVAALRAVHSQQGGQIQQQTALFLPPPRIVEQTAAAPENGRRVWTLKFDRRLYGDAVVWTEVRQSRPVADAAVDAAAGDAADQPPAALPVLTPPVLDIVGAERQNGHIAVVAGSDQRVTLTATDADGQPLPLIDPVEFPESFTFPVQALRSGQKRIVASVQYLQPGFSAGVSDQRFERTAVPTAVCRQVTYETVVSPSGELQHEATYEIVAVGVQSLAVRLPDGDSLWAALVDGNPVEVRRGESSLSLPLPPVDQADQVRTVQLLYRGATDSLSGTGSFRQTPPLVSVITGQGGDQPLEVLEQRWVVHHSPDTLLLESDGRFHTEGPMYAGTILGRLGGLWSLPTRREGIEMVVIAGIVLTLLVLGVASLKRLGRWPTIGMLSIGGLVILVALLLPAVQQNREAARRSIEQDRKLQLSFSNESAPAADEYFGYESSEAGESEGRSGGMGGFGGGGGGLGGVGGGAFGDSENAPEDRPAMEQEERAAGLRARRSISGSNRGEPQSGGRDFNTDGAMPPPASEPVAPPLAVQAPAAQAAGAEIRRFGQPAQPSDFAASTTAPPASPDRISPTLNPNRVMMDIELPKSSLDSVTPAFSGFNQLGSQPSDGQPGSGRMNQNKWAASNLGDLNANGIADPFGTLLGQAPSSGGAAAAGGEVDGRMDEFAAGKDAGGALLSLALALAPPENFVAREFRYVGSESDPAAVDLDVAYADRSGSQLLLAAIAGGVLLLLWWLRSSPLSTRGLLAVVAIAGPLAAASLAPTAWLVPLDGVLVGGLLGVGLWLVRALTSCCACCCQWWQRKCHNKATAKPTDPPSTGAPVAAGLWLLIASALLTGTNVSAEEPAPPFPPAEAGRPVVIVPYVVGTDPLAAEQVLVPHEYFLKLWKAARPDEQPEGTPPVAAVVAAAIYSAELEPAADNRPTALGNQRTVKVTARFVLRQLVEESTQLALPIGPVAIESALLEGQLATLNTREDGSALEVVLTKPGLQVLDVVFRVPATNVTDDSGRLTLPLRPVATGRLSFAVPAGEETEVRLNGSTDAYRIRAVDGVRTLETNVDRGGDLTLAWRPKTAHGAGEGTVQVESTIGATVDDAGLTVRHRFRYVVTQGALADVSFSLPNGVSVKRIAGADVSGWEQSTEGDLRTLKVFLRRDVDDSTALDLDLFQPLSLTETDVSVDIPTLLPTGITRERGDLAVFAEPQLAVQTGTVAGLRQVNVATFTMDSALTQPGAIARFAYRFDARPFTLPVALSRRQPETRVASEHGAQVLLRKVLVASRFQFDLREAPRANLSFTLPADYLALDVQGDFLVDWSVGDVDGNRVLTVELDEPRTGRLQMLLQGTQPRDATAAGVSITVPQPIAVNRQESQLGVWIDDAFTGTVGTLADWRSLDPVELGQAIRELRTTLPQFGFRSTQTNPGAVAVDLQRAQPELSADAVLLAAASDASLDYGLTLRWRIDRAAADQFVVTTPEWMGDRVDFQGEGIRQIESLPRAAGGRAWRITLHEPVQGQYLLSAVSTLPLPADDTVRIPDIRFLRPDQPVDEAAELAIQRRFLVLVNLSGVHRLDPVDADFITPAQRDQLPLKIPEALLNQAIEIASLPVGRALPEWKLTSTAGTQAAAATVLLADLRTVLAHDGSWRTQADYRIRNRGRQFLAIVPPTDSRLLSVLVREQPSQAIRQEINGITLLLVPLPATSIVDLSFGVRLVFAGRLPSALPEGLSLAATEITLPAPQVASKAQSEEFWLPVLQTLWRVDVPDDIQATIVDGGGRSNVIPGDTSAAEVAYGKTMLDDLKAQLSIASIRENARKSQSQDHLHNLGIAIDNAKSMSVASDAKASREQAELVEKATEQLEELQLQIQDGTDLDGEASLDRNDFGRNYIIGNNLDILNFNGAVTLPDEQALQLDDGINFAGNRRILDEVAQNRPAAKAEGQLKELNKSRAAVKGQLTGQDLSYFNSAQAPGMQFEQLQDGGLMPSQGVGGITGLAGQQGGQYRLSMPMSAGRSQLRSRTIRNQTDAASPAASSDDVLLFDLHGLNTATFVLQGGTDLAYDVSGRAGGSASQWSQAGGLSLDVTLPRGGRELTFTKVGGDAQLTLAVRPQATVNRGLGLVWGLACLIAAVCLVRWLTSGGATRDRVAWVVMIVGLIVALLLPSPLRFVGLVLFLAGAGWLVVRRVAAVHAD